MSGPRGSSIKRPVLCAADKPLRTAGRHAGLFIQQVQEIPGEKMQLALYRAERPEVFEDIIGQKHIVRILQNQIRTGTVSQAYLFSGTHGTGKTSTARILAKAVNCLEGEPGMPAAETSDGSTIPCGHCTNCEAIREGRFVDVIELDAASNNGVDDLRAIIDMVKYPPSVGRYKVYIIDEVHMLSQAAENAF